MAKKICGDAVPIFLSLEILALVWLVEKSNPEENSGQQDGSFSIRPSEGVQFDLQTLARSY